ncbi:Crp/Fnr family transcriptional regulator [Aureimonas sp. AU4]|uniref:Crp/Fnr family transcriptional regulator n=1 Tax=Aureimonas sp. AU4 TaxID=1638163 RepID=UPI000782F678|nr:Crp/Fnr family transcriptional regulator [Aureimonas sp. AU4]
MTEPIRNRLLAALSHTGRNALMSQAEIIDLPVRTTLVEPNVPTTHVFFLESGLASVVATSRDGAEQIEVGHLGLEGLSGLHLLLGTDRTPNHTFMQVAGSGLRVPSEHLLELLSADEKIRIHFLRFVQSYQIQLAHSALANGRYTIPQRLARWLLMCHDRLRTDDMRLTHEFLALMLGVRRSGVTNEIHILEGEHAIRANRASIRVLDRQKLIDIADGCYGVPEEEYARLIEGHMADA